MPRKKQPVRVRRKLDLSLQTGRGVRIDPLSADRVRALVQACLQHDMTISLRFTGRVEAQALNWQFRRRRYTPNVLTFAYWPEPSADIVICTPVVRVQARDQNKRYGDHLSHMIVHGALHAQGYDHDTDATAAKMQALEADILGRFGVTAVYQ